MVDFVVCLTNTAERACAASKDHANRQPKRGCERPRKSSHKSTRHREISEMKENGGKLWNIRKPGLFGCVQLCVGQVWTVGGGI